MAQEIADSKLIDTWSSSGLIVKPDISKIIEGWQFGEQPPHEYMNWLENTFGSKLNHILKNGIAKWNDETEYLSGATIQHNGSIWTCQETNVNSEPTELNNKWGKIPSIENLALTVDTIDEFPTSAITGDVCIVKDLDRGGIFIYDSTKVSEDNRGTNFNGWIRQFSGAVNVKWFGAKGDGITDDTVAITYSCLFNKIYFPSGTYIINTVEIFNSIGISCADGVVLKRKDNTNVASGSYWDTGAAMFEIKTNGIDFKIDTFTFDGNSANQTTVEPTGFFIKTQPPTAITANPISVHINNGIFINGTSGYILLRGDDVNRRYDTLAYLNDCRFYDTIYGVGKGDPSTPNPLGYNPTYVLIEDYVKCRTNNFHAQFDKVTGTGQYAATAINGTFFGTVYANSGESFVWMDGTTYIKNMGRSAKRYDDGDWVTNNGIGAIDMYGNADTLFIEHLVADSCQNVPMRAKGSTRNYTVLDAVLTNCHRGLQVSPSTTGACETRVFVGSLKSYGGTIPQLEFVGTSTSDLLASVDVCDAHMSGTFTNPESLTSIGMVNIRNAAKVTLNSIGVFGSPLRGLHVQNYGMATLSAIVVNTTTNGEGIYISGGRVFTLSGFEVLNTSSVGITIAANPTLVTISNGRINNVVGYGVFSNTTTTQLQVENVYSDTVTGTSRAFYAGGGDVAFIRNYSTGATTPLFVVSGTNKREDHNSWNAVIQYASSAPTAGTWKVGDITYNTIPTAGGTMGWVCITAGNFAGTPPVFKTFGVISA